MRILALETSGQTAEVVLWEDGRVVARDRFEARLELGEQLAGRILGVLGVDRVANARIDAIACSTGPGGFTSLRIGVATAKALAHSLGVALVGVPTPLAIAQAAVNRGLDSAVREIWVVQPARRARGGQPAEVYLSRYRVSEGGELEAVGETAAVTEADAAALGGGSPGVVVVETNDPDAATVANAAARALAGRTGDEHLTLRPLYVTRSQAEMTHSLDLGLSGG